MILDLIDKWLILEGFLIINCWLREPSHINLSLRLRLFSWVLLTLWIWISSTLLNNEVWSSIIYYFDFFEWAKVIFSLSVKSRTAQALISITMHIWIYILCFILHHILVWPQNLHVTVVLGDLISLLWLLRFIKWRLRNCFY